MSTTRACLVTALLGTVSCGGTDEEALPATSSPTGRCLVTLHGKGGEGGSDDVSGDLLTIRPSGNADGWSGRQWMYFPESSYREAVDVVAEALDGRGCRRVVLHGFSNGAAFAAKMLCRGETFDDRVVGVVIDDPVPDAGVGGSCTEPAGVDAVLYWTGALAQQAPPGTQCDTIDWTCEGGSVVDVDAYATALGLEVIPSVHTQHTMYIDAPEIGRWLA